MKISFKVTAGMKSLFFPDFFKLISNPGLLPLRLAFILGFFIFILTFGFFPLIFISGLFPLKLISGNITSGKSISIFCEFFNDLSFLSA